MYWKPKGDSKCHIDSGGTASLLVGEKALENVALASQDIFKAILINKAQNIRKWYGFCFLTHSKIFCSSINPVFL